LFFTRWITHFCAPVFVFLAGASAYFQGLRKTKSELGLLLITRGLWLIAIEIFVMSLGISFDIHYSLIFFQTIWSIGISMVLLGIVLRLPFAAIFVLGLLIVFGHNLLDFAEKNHKGNFNFFWSIVHRPNVFNIWDNHNLMILYPFLPWTGLMMLGYCFGKLFHNTPSHQRIKVLTILGSILIMFFILLRATNVYGDPDPWSKQKNVLYSFFSFINIHKYPPSLLFMCITIGPALLFLAWVGNARTRFSKFITVYGRVPFFYYVLHFYVLHLICAGLFLARGHTLNEGLNSGFMLKFVVPGEGYGLGIVYLIWILVILALYPLCKWFSEYKRTHKKWWLSYL
jgi:uncharacterized membrane protein